jgi:diguanylate cyclase (GGDEF)-like protein
VGDRILCKVAAVVGKHFRNNDCVCRIGGDEFVTIMLHSGRAHQELIAGKVEQINTELRDTADGLPQISVSAGVAFGEEAATTQQLFEHADAALYETKRRGRKGVSFYHALDL